jgi:fermentation-respiration switch protein FrsA (DUF1100 family)
MNHSEYLLDEPVMFHSHGVPLAGRLFHPAAAADERRPIVITTGSWLTVKEQMATLYARRLARAGYTTFCFDFSGFGQSRGEPRLVEMPARKIADLQAAVEFLRTLSFVDPARIGCVAVCASAQYLIEALARGMPVRSFASVAGWFHSPASVAPFYGGAAGVALRLERGRAALERYLTTGELVTVPAYGPGDERAGMHFELEYYARPERGAVPAWSNQMAEMSWVYWLSYDGLAASRAVTAPGLFVHADGCVFPEHVRRVHDALPGPKRLVWSEGAQIDFYDQPRQIESAIDAIQAWFDETLRA